MTCPKSLKNLTDELARAGTPRAPGLGSQGSQSDSWRQQETWLKVAVGGVLTFENCLHLHGCSTYWLAIDFSLGHLLCSLSVIGAVTEQEKPEHINAMLMVIQTEVNWTDSRYFKSSLTLAYIQSVTSYKSYSKKQLVSNRTKKRSSKLESLKLYKSLNHAS